MALPKNKAWLLKGCLLVSLVLSGCGGQALSEREIVRGVFFAGQDGGYSACLVLADQEAESNADTEHKIAAGQGQTPAQALQRAEESLYGDVYYGLLDLAVLPADSSWQTAQEIGTLLYENAQPAPELAVFLLGEEPVKSWAEEGSTIYRRLKAVEQTAQVHCGLQQLFTSSDICAVPALSDGAAYDFVLLPQNGDAVRSSGMTAQLAAVLCGQTTRMEGTFAFGAGRCRARAQVTMEGNHVRLHLRDAEFQSLDPSMQDIEAAFCGELQQAFTELCRQVQATGTDPFSFRIWQFSTYGTNAVPANPVLDILIE
ncbi:MAG: hypothetical protein ACLTWO_06650 [Blautia massiliensis (ex Durand et al. 2017)]